MKPKPKFKGGDIVCDPSGKHLVIVELTKRVGGATLYRLRYGMSGLAIQFTCAEPPEGAVKVGVL